MQGLLVVWDNLGIVGIKGREEKRPAKFHIPAWCGRILTFGFFNLSLFFFRSEDMGDALQMFKNLLSFDHTGKIFEVANAMNVPEFYMIKEAVGLAAPSVVKYVSLLVFVVYLLFSFFLISGKNALQIATDGKLTSKKCWAVSIIFIWCIISLSQVSTFLYFNF